MKEQNYWEQFINSGKIEDYLSFKSMKKESDTSGGGTSVGDNPYAGVCEVNRNGNKDSAYRGIR